MMKFRKFMYWTSSATVLCIILAICGQLRSEETAVTVFAEKETAHFLVIDAGHGGLDGGAVGISGVLESDINLEIAQKLEAIAVLTGEAVVMTRDSADIDYPDPEASIAAKKSYDQNQRISLINSLADATVISIHQNTYTTAQPSGVSVFYRETDKSCALAEKLQSELCAVFCPESRRLASQISDKIYLMNSINKDAVLVECGFLSNPTECELLSTDSYQTKMAMTIYSAYRDML